MNKHASGFTLLELLITIVILVILATAAVPSFIDTLDRRRIINATHAMIEQAQLARSVAVSRNQEINMVVRGNEQNWCIGLTNANTCNCNEPLSCQIPFPEGDGTDVIEARILSNSFPGVRLTNHSSPVTPVRFEPTRGIRTDGGAADIIFQFTSDRGVRTQVGINIIGRVATCSPSSNSLIGGIQPCPPPPTTSEE